MKTLIIAFFALSLMSGKVAVQDTDTIKAVFNGYEEEIYYFSGENDNSYEFQRIEEVAMNQYDLTDTKYKGETFEVSYKIETETDDDDEEYSIYVIVNLKLIE